MTMPAEAPAPEPRKKGLKGLLTNKIGPLPTWVWVLIVAGLILAYAWYKNSQGASQQTSSPQGAGTGQVPQFVNQTFTTVGPPAAPDQDEDQDKDKQDQDQGPGIPPGPHRPPSRNPPPTSGGRPPRRREPPRFTGGGPPRRRRRDRDRVGA